MSHREGERGTAVMRGAKRGTAYTIEIPHLQEDRQHINVRDPPHHLTIHMAHTVHTAVDCTVRSNVPRRLLCYGNIISEHGRD